mmetsp:Transcript_19735/g.62125  ORF Transcript_19735/g.62125 Transcript_19735/m.62125 type:complete len:216 (+) Transcript_19735:53-700(+)
MASSFLSAWLLLACCRALLALVTTYPLRAPGWRFSCSPEVRRGHALMVADGKKAQKKKASDRQGRKLIIASNRRAKFDYEIVSTYEAGIELVGTEVKSCRAGKVQLRDSFGRVEKNTVWLLNVDIAQHATTGGYFQHDPKRKRRLLMHKAEARKLRSQLDKQGTTLIPLNFYFNEKNLLKVELALCRGKNKRDKREDIKRKDEKRMMDRISKSIF